MIQRLATSRYFRSTLRSISDWTWAVTGTCYEKDLEDKHCAASNTLPWFNSHAHNENDVKASSSHARAQLTPREFTAAGGLRAGAKLQLLRLAREVNQRPFSLGCKDVATLLMCALSQAGPPPTKPSFRWLREAWAPPRPGDADPKLFHDVSACLL